MQYDSKQSRDNKSFNINFKNDEFNSLIDEINKIYTKVPPDQIPTILALKDSLVYSNKE